MKAAKAIVPRALASRDVEQAIDHYLVEANERVAFGFVDALEKAYHHIAHHPMSGSPRHGYPLGLPDLRSWPIDRYPYLVFYVEHDDQSDVWRVLHQQRDIPTWIDEP